MSRILRVSAALMVLASTHGCVIPDRFDQTVGDLRQEGFRPAAAVPPERISANTPYAGIERVQFVLLLTSSNNDPIGYRRFVENSLRSMGFPAVLDEAAYARRILAADSARTVTASLDLVSLKRATDLLGPFLVMDLRLRFTDVLWRHSVEVVDPERSETLLAASFDRVPLRGLEHDMTYPAMNLIRDWTIRSK